jgi:hypothetical protein
MKNSTNTTTTSATTVHHLDAYKWPRGRSGNPAGRPPNGRPKAPRAPALPTHDDLVRHLWRLVRSSHAVTPGLVACVRLLTELIPREVPPAPAAWPTRLNRPRLASDEPDDVGDVPTEDDRE